MRVYYYSIAMAKINTKLAWSFPADLFTTSFHKCYEQNTVETEPMPHLDLFSLLCVVTNRVGHHITNQRSSRHRQISINFTQLIWPATFSSQGSHDRIKTKPSLSCMTPGENAWGNLSVGDKEHPMEIRVGIVDLAQPQTPQNRSGLVVLERPKLLQIVK